MDLKGKNVVTATIKFILEDDPAELVKKIMADIWGGLDPAPEEFIVTCEKANQNEDSNYKNN